MATLAEILKLRSPVINVLTPETCVAEAARVMAERRVGAVLLVAGGKLAGIFSERDLVRRVIAKGRPLDRTPLREVMTPDPITASPVDQRMSAVVKMQSLGCRHLPIILEGQVVDMVSIRDLLFAEIEERDSVIEELRRYIHGTAP